MQISLVESSLALSYSSWFSDLRFVFFVRRLRLAHFLLYTPFFRKEENMENSDKKPQKSEAERKEIRELFNRAINEAVSSKFDRIIVEAKDIELPEPSERHRLEMNRILREATDGAFIPYPEANA